MITDQDKTWLSQKHPKLILNAGKISGEIEFTGTYNKQTGKFLQIEKDTGDPVGGVRLSGQFKIHIEERDDTSNSKLPALFVEGVEHIADRHFNQTDSSGCLCSSLEENEFLQPQFQFQKYLKELVIPFLYGQLFFSKEKYWPWFEYAHGGLGLLESYLKEPTREKAEECLKKISRELPLWRRIRPLLIQKSAIKGHTSCPCPKRDHIRRCHPCALKGLRRLKEDIKTNKILLP